MLKKFWDALVQKAIEQMVGAAFLTATAVLGTSAVLLEWTQTPNHWRRFVMALVGTLCYWVAIRFAPRWMIPRTAGTTADLSVETFFEQGTLYLGVTNNGPTDDFVAELRLIDGLREPWPVFPHYLRWRQQTSERREIVRGGTQNLEIMRVPFEQHAPPTDWRIRPLVLYSPIGETNLNPFWVKTNVIMDTLYLMITFRAVEQDKELRVRIHLNVAAHETTIHRAADVMRD